MKQKYRIFITAADFFILKIAATVIQDFIEWIDHRGRGITGAISQDDDRQLYIRIVLDTLCDILVFGPTRENRVCFCLFQLSFYLL